MPKAKAKPPRKPKSKDAATEKCGTVIPMPPPESVFQDLKVETVSLDDLYLDPANARKHGLKNLEAIKSSLRNFGQVEPIVVAPDGKIIGGNGRWSAMREMGWTEAKVVRVGLNPSQATALGIALNRSAELAEWELGTLTGLLEGLREENIDLNDLGFNDDDLVALARELEKETVAEHGNGHDPDDIPEDAPSVCKVGDLWQVGRHRLLCGDSTLIDHMQRLCGDDKVDAVVTDPPYGVNIVGGNHSLTPEERLKRGGKTIQNDGKIDLRELLTESLGNVATVCRPGAVWYVWSPANADLFLEFAKVLSDLQVWRHSIIWVKDSLVMGRTDYHYRHEHCFYGWSEGKHMTPPDRKQDTVWEVDRPKRSADHPTMKPVELMERCIKNSTIKDNIVLEPFNGSGTTLVACERTGRTCYAMEIDPRYVDSTLKRWSKLTGQDPILIDGPDEEDDS